METDDRANPSVMPADGREEIGDPLPIQVGTHDDRDLPPFLTPQETATRLRVSVWAVYDAVKAETLPAVRVGRAIRIPRHAVVAKSTARLPAEA